MDFPLSSSPSKTLTSWWKAFKQRDEEPRGSEPGAGRLRRPQLPHMSHSSSALPKQGASEALTVTNEGKQVVIPREYAASPIFGAPLGVSIRYASVKISLTDGQGNNFVYGRVPVLVAKCSVYLKKEAREIPGIFRISGSVRRIKLLQDMFDQPPRFGKDTDWQGFTVHDAANVLRRYLTNLAEPIVPLEWYGRFRDALREQPEILNYMEVQAKLLSPGGGSSGVAGLGGAAPATSVAGTGGPTGTRFAHSPEPDPSAIAIDTASGGSATASPYAAGTADPATPTVPPPSDEAVAVALKAYKDLIFRLPPVNLHLVVYLLDLLAVFNAYSAENLMPAYNLAAVFQPSMLSHPKHDQDPSEYRLSRLVVEFLITHAMELLKHVEAVAIAEHERVAAASGQASTEGSVVPESAAPAASTQDTTVEAAPVPASADPSDLVAPARDSTDEAAQSLSVRRQRPEVPSLVVTSEDPDLGPSGPRRHHSKSLSSARPPPLHTPPTERGGGVFSALRRQVSVNRREWSGHTHGNDSQTSLAAASVGSGVADEGELRATSPGRSDHESIKSRFRRSLLLFRPDRDDDGHA